MQKINAEKNPLTIELLENILIATHSGDGSILIENIEPTSVIGFMKVLVGGVLDIQIPLLGAQEQSRAPARLADGAMAELPNGNTFVIESIRATPDGNYYLLTPASKDSDVSIRDIGGLL